MPEQALYLKWRPLSFDEVVGQEHITRTIRNSIKTGRIRHAYLFSGPRGTGKTTSARLLAKAVNCRDEDPEKRPCNDCATCIAVNEGRFLDLIEIDAASHTGVDDVRDLRDKIAFAPSEGRYKVYIIDEVHRFSGNAFDALLKTLEEPPEHAMFILATTEIDKVPATIKSRCLPFEFRRLSLREVTERLAFIAEQEGLHIEPAALELVAREGTGSVRDSISLLDQIVADPDETITLELTQRILGTASARAVRDLVDALLRQEIGHGLHVINQAIDNGSDPRQFGQQIVEHLRSILLAQTASADLLDASADDQQLYAEQAQMIAKRQLLRAVRAFNDAVNNYTGGWQPQLALELALIESLQEPEVQVIQQTVAQRKQGTSSAATQNTPESVANYERAAPSQPGAAPVIAPSVVKEKWLEAQSLIFSNTHKATGNTGELVVNLPNLMDHAQVQTVEGNQILVSVQSKVFFDKLTEPTRLAWVERAISRVTESPLRIRYILADDLDTISTTNNDILDDPLIQEGLGLGGQIQENDE
ncbi:MAG: DNA polymerase III subunit gamma/tau [Anaerolineae bacterium]|nr:DNA polymerase III subunit gamma/tau [Anaerolineae bacterium]